MNCARCSAATLDEFECWWCGARICTKCLLDYGQCGHMEANAIEEQMRNAEDDDQRRTIFRDAMGKAPEGAS